MTAATARAPFPTTPGALLCPRCGNALADEQGWCLECGLAARTRVHPPPNWRIPILATIVLLALIAAAIAVGLGTLLGKDKPSPAATTVTVPAGTPGVTETVPAGTPGVTETVPAAPGATPGAATTTPSATTTPGATGTPNRKPLVLKVGGRTITLPSTGASAGGR